MKRFLIALFSLIGAVVFAFPNLAFFSLFFFAYFGKYVSAIFCLIFAYNIAKLVKSKYEKSISKDTSNRDSDGRWHYETVDEEVRFTFVIKDTDGRQIDRLKFMRESFFKEQ